MYGLEECMGWDTNLIKKSVMSFLFVVVCLFVSSFLDYSFLAVGQPRSLGSREAKSTPRERQRTGPEQCGGGVGSQFSV